MQIICVVDWKKWKMFCYFETFTGKNITLDVEPNDKVIYHFFSPGYQYLYFFF